MTALAADKRIHTNDLAVAQAIATDYQRELLAMIPERELAEISDFTFQGLEGELELTVGGRILTLPAGKPTLLDTLEHLQEHPEVYARAWGRLYAEVLEGEILHAGQMRQRMDSIMAEELGYSKPAPGQERLNLGGGIPG